MDAIFQMAINEWKGPAFFMFLFSVMVVAITALVIKVQKDSKKDKEYWENRY